MLLNFALVFFGLILILLTAIIIVSNHKNKANLFLAGFLFTGFIWLLFNLLANQTTTVNDELRFSRLALPAAYLLSLMYWKFCVHFVASQKQKNYQKLLLWLMAVVVAALSFTDLNAGLVNGEIVFGSLYFVAIPMIIYNFFIGSWILIKAKKNANHQKKQQLTYIYWGIVLSVVPALIFNAVLPLLGYVEAAELGALSVVFFSSFATFAIVKHKLLDIRLLAARALAYILVLITLVSIYSFVVFVLLGWIFEDIEYTRTQQVVSMFSAALLALTFQPLKQFFDRVTNRVFFRDGYNTQTKIKILGDILAEEIEIKVIAEKVTGLLMDAIRSQHVQLLVFDESKVFYSYSTDEREEYPSVKGLKRLKKTVSISDDLNGGKNLLKKHNIDLAVKIKTQGVAVGFLLFGSKASGSIYTSQDIDLLTIASKELAIALENAKNFAEIEQFNETLKKKIKIATNNLREKNKKLRELDHAKDDFISMASHQLRTPLTTIKGYLSMLSDGDLGKLDEKQQQVVESAFASSERMVYLISDLLNASRINTGKFVIDKKPVKLKSVIENEIKQLSLTAEARDIKLTAKLGDKDPVLNLDANKLKQVIMNFIDNAIYYSERGSEVVIDYHVTADAVELQVKDNGIGVPKEALNNLFTKFYRAENAKRVRPDGTGLGLFLAKKVITAQGGFIIFESEIGEGSTFGFRFALSAVATNEEPTN